MKKIVIFSLLVLISQTFVWAQCSPTVTISGVYTTTYKGSNTWIASSGITTIPTGSNVTLDANPLTNGYVLLNPGFETQPNTTFTAVVLTPCAANPTSQVISSLCGATLSGWYTTIGVTWVTGATEYRFRITELDKFTNLPIGIPVIVDRPVNNICLCNIPGTKYDSKYQIEVDTKVGGIWQNSYGPACSVTTPNPISTIGTQCGTTLSIMNQWVTTTMVPVVLQYRFRVTELDSSLNPVGLPKIITQPWNKFNMTQLSGILYNTTYRVEVSLRNTDGIFLPYNTACNITTPAYPTTKIQSSQCSSFMVTNKNQLIFADGVTGAIQYRFRLFNSSYDNYIDATYSRFKLNDFSGLSTGSSYSVQVAVKMPGELNFGPYSTTCTLTTPALLRTISDNLPINNDIFKVIAYPNPFASNFLLDITSSNDTEIKVKVYNMLGSLIEEYEADKDKMSRLEIGANYASGVYNIIVSQNLDVRSIRVIKK